MSEHLFYYVAIVPALGIFAQAISWWTRLPSIIVLLLFGVLLGLFVNPDAILNDLAGETGQPIAAQVLFPFVSLAVGIILFEGGLTLRLRDLKGGGVAVFRLVSVGAIVCWVLTTFLAHYLLNMDWRIALLLGAMLVVTGPTVVAPLIRHIRPNKKISSIIKWEGIVIDPIGAIFAVLVFENVIHVGSERPILSALIMMLNATLVGVAIAAATASCLVLMVKRYWIPDYLHGVMFLSAAMGSFALSNFLVHESGLVTTTVLGIILANQKFISIDEIVRFKENLGVLLISSLFIVLGSRLDLSQLAGLGPQAFLFVFLLIFLVRPVSTWIALLGTDTSINEKIFLSFLAPRGIVAAAVISVFSLRIMSLSASNPSLANLAPDAEQLVPITFLVILLTVAGYGVTAAPLARRLGLADANPQGVLFAGADHWIRDLAKTLQNNGFSVVLVDTNYSHISEAKMMGLNAYCASILSDFVREEMDLPGVGYFAALTRNDEVNELGVNEFAHTFSLKNVFRLPLNDATKGRRATLGGKTRGRQLFKGDWNEKKIWQAYQTGWRCKLTKLTSEFTFQDFEETYGKDYLLIAVIDANRNLTFVTKDSNLQLTAGKSLICLSMPNKQV